MAEIAKMDLKSTDIAKEKREPEYPRAKLPENMPNIILSGQKVMLINGSASKG